MNFWIGVGALFGAVLGGMAGGLFGATVVAIIGGSIGALIGRAVARTPAAAAPTSEPPPAPRYGPAEASAAPPLQPIVATEPPAPAPPTSTLGREILRRLDALDARLSRIEARLGGAVPGAAEAMLEPMLPIVPEASVAAPAMRASARADRAAGSSVDVSPAATREGAPAEPRVPLPVHVPIADARPTARRADEGAPQQDIAADARAAAPTRAADGTLQPVEKAATVDAAPPHEPPAEPPPRAHDARADEAPPAEPSALWRWLTGGNAVTRIGIVILFFGVAFLLTYFAEVVTVPIELKLAGAGAGGLALAALGVVLARRRPAYGLSLQGAGMGVVYLVVFAAFRLYEVLGPATSIALLVVVAASTVGLALRHDSQPLAGLALAGGFLAPVLIRTDVAGPGLLFGYFAVLNAAVFAIAWRRAWRPLNVLGFVFTFALALLWGHRYYTPAHYDTVQGFLALFFLFYVAIAIRYARQSPLDARSPVDGMLVFGVPIAGFALQMAIVRGHRYGVAISAGVLAAFYASLWAWLRTQDTPGSRLLARSFVVLAISFATLAIPFAADPRATSAWWAIEAAAVYWIGAAQRQPLARAFALALQAAAAIAFVVDVDPVATRPVANAHFLGALLIGVAALATSWVADRCCEAIGPRERALVPWIFVWGGAWWTLAGLDEMRRLVTAPAHFDASLAWVGLTTALALAASRLFAWPRVAWLGATLPVAMLVVGMREFEREGTTLAGYGALVWPLSWALLFALLRVVDHERVHERSRVAADAVALAHTVVAIALVAWCSWEAAHWTGRVTRAGSVWLACAAALPGIAYLAVVLVVRDSPRWPFPLHGDAYAKNAGTAIATLLVVWFAFVNVLSSGSAQPLPYVPIVNPLDLTLLATLAIVALWSGRFTSLDARTRLGGLGIAAFVALNGTVVRTAHHWGDVRWRFADLAAYKPLQAALTLTWTATALAIMVVATRRSLRAAWMVGGALLAAVVVKLFVLDLAALSGLTRVVAFMGVGLLLLVIGYVAPIPPAPSAATDAAAEPRAP